MIKGIRYNFCATGGEDKDTGEVSARIYEYRVNEGRRWETIGFMRYPRAKHAMDVVRREDVCNSHTEVRKRKHRKHR